MGLTLSAVISLKQVCHDPYSLSVLVMAVLQVQNPGPWKEARDDCQCGSCSALGELQG